MIIAITVLNIISIFICYYIAKKRKASVDFWAAMGLILGPLAVLLVFFSKPVKNIQIK